MKKIFYYRDLLERNLKKNELQDLLEANGQEVPTGIYNLVLRGFQIKFEKLLMRPLLSEIVLQRSRMYFE